jgi:hypothetical protein
MKKNLRRKNDNSFNIARVSAVVFLTISTFLLMPPLLNLIFVNKIGEFPVLKQFANYEVWINPITWFFVLSPLILGNYLLWFRTSIGITNKIFLNVFPVLLILIDIFIIRLAGLYGDMMNSYMQH